MKTKYIIPLIITFFFACKDNNKSNDLPNATLYSPELPTYRGNNTNNYHIDYNNKPQTYKSINYQYNYDVYGYDEYGNSIEGNIDVSDGIGGGYIYDEYGNEINVEVEFTGYGELEDYDENGNYYELSVE